MKKIAYITTCFGSLSHTFLRREVFTLRKLAVDISLFGIRPNAAEELSADNKQLVDETIYLYPLRIPDIIRFNFYFMITKPLNYFTSFLHALFNEEKSLLNHFRLIYHFLISPFTAFHMQRKGIGHIHAHFMNVPATLAMYCARILGISFSITMHSAGIARDKKMLALRQKLMDAKFVVTTSHYGKDYIGEKMYACKGKIYVIRCGVDLKKYNFVPHHTGKLILISIGRFVEKKGFTYLIKAAKLLKEEGVSFIVNMVGEGPLKTEIGKQVKDFGLEHEVVFKGPLSESQVRAEFSKSHMLIVPSVESRTGDKEGVPIVIMEAMASGTFVIATEHSGIPEIVKNRITGFLVPERDPCAIAGAVKLAQNDADLTNGCIHRARTFLYKEGNIEESAKVMKKILEKYT